MKHKPSVLSTNEAKVNRKLLIDCVHTPSLHVDKPVETVDSHKVAVTCVTPAAAPTPCRDCPPHRRGVRLAR